MSLFQHEYILFIAKGIILSGLKHISTLKYSDLMLCLILMYRSDPPEPSSVSMKSHRSLDPPSNFAGKNNWPVLR